MTKEKQRRGETAKEKQRRRSSMAIMTEDEIRQSIAEFDRACRIDENWAMADDDRARARDCKGAKCEAWFCRTCGPEMATRYYEFLLRRVLQVYESGGKIYQTRITVTSPEELRAIRSRIRGRLFLRADRNERPNYFLAMAGDEAYILSTVDISGTRPPTTTKELGLMEAIKWLNTLLVTPLPTISISPAHNFASTRAWQRVGNAPYKASGSQRKQRKEGVTAK
jgi:hypothetical protein